MLFKQAPMDNQEIVNDFLIDLFYSACTNFKRATLASPFPPQFRRGDDKDFSGCLDALEVPQDRRFVELKQWITRPERVSLEIVAEDEWRNNLTLATSKSIVKLLDDGNKRLNTPDIVFQVNSPASSKFKESVEKYSSFLSFHGTDFARGHSILHNGLHNHQNQRTLFGPGIYTASRLDVAKSFTKPGVGRPSSKLSKGRKMEIVFALEVCNNPESVFRESNPHVDKTMFDDHVPEGYFVVTDNEMVKVTWILLYFHDRHDNDTSKYLVFALLFFFILYMMSLNR